MSEKKNASKIEGKKAFAAFIILLIVIGVAWWIYYSPSQNQISNSGQSSNQDKQKTRREFIIEVTSSNGHRAGISVEDENGKEFYSTHFECDDNATKEYKIEAGVGDIVIVEVLCPWETSYALVRLAKESALFRHTIAYESDFDRVILIHTIKEDDM
jgi:hypothetical protein